MAIDKIREEMRVTYKQINVIKKVSVVMTSNKNGFFC